jgi:hypothetical protein
MRSNPTPQPRAAGSVRLLPWAPWRRPVLYPNVYVWYVLLSALDIMLTWTILHLDGVELNLLADWVIHHGGLPGMVAYKFVLVLLVVAICEVVGRRRDRVGRRLSEWAVAITAVPVGVAFAQLALDVLDLMAH